MRRGLSAGWRPIVLMVGGQGRGRDPSVVLTIMAAHHVLVTVRDRSCSVGHGRDVWFFAPIHGHNQRLDFMEAIRFFGAIIERLCRFVTGATRTSGWEYLGLILTMILTFLAAPCLDSRIKLIPSRPWTSFLQLF